MKRGILAMIGGTTAVVAALFGQARPVIAQVYASGKTSVIGGVPGCDCVDQTKKECYCLFNS